MEESKRKYQDVEIEIFEFENTDTITTSNELIPIFKNTVPGGFKGRY